ncbi:hypothetical protein KKC17_02285 [Patescibacteria group bacterium]|nr:hypothetical protein [Patescibacteria group bacterium]
MVTQNIIKNIPLRDQQFFERLSDYANWLIVQDDIGTSYEFLKKIKSAVEQDKSLDQLTKNNYNKIIWLLHGECLPFLNNDEVLEFFRQGLSVVLGSNEIDLLAKLEAKLLRILIHEDRDILKKNLKEVLVNSRAIFVESHGASGSLRTVGDWLKDYISVVGVEISDSLKREQYMSQRESLKKLDPAVKEEVRKLLVLFDYLGHSSLTPEGLEEKGSFIENDKKIILDKGQVREIQEADAGPIISKILPKKELKEVKIETSNTPQVLKSSAPAFLFDEADEKEADKYRDQTNETKQTPKVPLEERLRDFAKEVIVKNNLSFKDEVNARRFELLFVSRLKEVRNQVEVKESLMKLVTVGGLGLSEPVADKVAGIIEKAKKDFESPIVDRQSLKINNKPAKISTGKQEIDKLIAAELPVVLPAKPVALPVVKKVESPQASIVRPEITVKPKIEFVKKEDVKLDRQKVLQELARSAAVSVGSASPVSNKNSSIKSDQPVILTKPKPQLTDVKAPSRLLGPLEELKTLTLVDFRRLSVKPTEALRKIQTKIELIGETSIAKKIEAIRSWQASEVYRNYLDLGRLSIEHGKSISQIISEQSLVGQIYLTEEEFQAVVDFNEKLRF